MKEENKTRGTFDFVKISYTAGAYGCSGEQFLFVCEIGDKKYSFPVNGLYGVEHRVALKLENIGLSRVYFLHNVGYGQVTKRRVKYYLTEEGALEYIKQMLERND